ncbi:MAG: MMPL family transporter, partial [Gammaproteobacteria bacterium]|nr:MMPL family transporter [Gammaproteobacteria bacterium]
MTKNDIKLGSLAALSYRHAYWVLSAVLIICLSAVLLAKKLTLDADLTALLPDSFDSVQDLDKAKKVFGGFGYIVLLASGSDPDRMRQYADDVATTFKKLDHIQFVENQRSNAFFEQHALYYVDVADLNEIYKRLSKRWRWEKRKRNPAFIDFEDSSPPSVDFSDIKEKYTANNKNDWLDIEQAHDKYYFNSDKTKIAIFLKPDSSVTDLKNSKNLLANVEKIISASNYANYGISEVKLTGRYKKQVDLQAQIQQDLKQASGIALALVIIYLLLHFRRPAALLLIAGPLLVGILVTLALAYLVFTQLNIVTGFIGVILLGLGIDHGIHLFSRFREEQHTTPDLEQAVRRTFNSTGRAVSLAALTTLTSFIALAISDFRAFHEFGAIAAIGMLAILIGYAVCMPALIRVLGYKPINVQQANTTGQFDGYTKILVKHKKVIWAAAAITVLLVLFQFKNLFFNYDFESLSSGTIPSFLLDKEVNNLLGHSQTPMIAMTASHDDEKAVI